MSYFFASISDILVHCQTQKLFLTKPFFALKSIWYLPKKLKKKKLLYKYNFHFQVTHEEQRDPGDAFKRAVIGFYLAHHLRLAGFFSAAETFEFSVKNTSLVTVVTLILRHLQSCSCNAYEIDEFVHHSKSGKTLINSVERVLHIIVF